MLMLDENANKELNYRMRKRTSLREMAGKHIPEFSAFGRLWVFFALGWNVLICGMTRDEYFQYGYYKWCNSERLKLLKKTYMPVHASILNRMWIPFDIAWCAIVYGASISEYFEFHFYKRKHISRKNFITRRGSVQMLRRFNDKNGKSILDHKEDFNERFADYLCRDWLDLDKADKKSWDAFVAKHEIFLVKDKTGNCGRGVYLQSVKDADSNAIYDELKISGVIIEELVQQINELAEFHPKSVNTVRVVSLMIDGEPKIMTSLFRMGNKGSCIDNFSSGGIAAMVDVESGIVVTAGLDHNNNKCYVHPVSKKQIIGCQIPLWEEIIDTVKGATKIISGARHIGWDIVVTNDSKICILEGNAFPDFVMGQMVDQIGKKDLYKEAIKS